MKKQLFITLLITLFISIWCLSAGAAEPIRIGSIHPLSGRVAFAGLPAKKTLDMMAEDLNKSGGINGRLIEMIHYDSEGKEDVTVRALNRLIQKDNVTAIIGPIESWTAMAVIPIIEKNQIPTIMTASGSMIVNPVKRWVFKTATSDELVVTKVLSYIKSKGIERIALMSSQDPYGEGGYKSVLAQAPDFKLKLVFDERFGGDETDLTPILNKIKKTDAQAVVSWSSKRTPNVVTINYRQVGLEIPLFLGHSALGPDFLKGTEKHGEGVITASGKFAGASGLQDSDPQKKVILDYMAAYKKKYGEETNQFAAGAFDALNMMTAALKKAGVEKVKLRDAIEQTRNYIGVYGVFNYSPNDHAGLSRESVVMYKVIGGEWKAIE
jgi:branched-chain amino acid transport system substrate-binding protein